MTGLENELRQFTGSDQFYRHPLFRKYAYTEGVQYLAEKAGAYWLIDFIFGHQENSAIKEEPFQVWIIRVKHDDSAEIKLEDGNNNRVESFRLTFTDFPLKNFSLWFVDGTLLLPSEY